MKKYKQETVQMVVQFKTVNTDGGAKRTECAKSSTLSAVEG